MTDPIAIMGARERALILARQSLPSDAAPGAVIQAAREFERYLLEPVSGAAGTSPAAASSASPSPHG